MKALIRTSLLSFGLFMSMACNVKAQSDVTEYLQWGQQNATVFMDQYLAPLNVALGTNMNSGWYNTAQAHRTGRFDVRINFPVTFIGASDRYFTFRESDFNDITLVNPQENQAPTLFGDDTEGPAVSFRGEEFHLPPGSGYHVFPLIPPSLQFHLGLVRDTEIMFRVFPKTTVQDFSTSTIGFGFKHGIKQYIPVIKHLPFDLAVIGAWSKFKASYALEYNPQNSPLINTEDQKLDLEATGFNINLIASKKLSVITFFGGFRYMNSNSDFMLMGDYPVASETADQQIILNNPVGINTGRSQVGLNGGFRLKLGVLSLFAEGTLSNNSNVSAGLSLGFHN